MSNIYFVVDNRIAFVQGESRPNGMVIPMPIASLVTKYGVLIPTSQHFANFLDYRAAGLADGISHASKWLTALVDSDGVLRDYYIDGEKTYLEQNRVTTGPGIRLCRGQWLTCEEQGMAALNLADSLEDVIDLFCKVDPTKREYFKIYEISALAKLAADIKVPK